MQPLRFLKHCSYVGHVGYLRFISCMFQNLGVFPSGCGLDLFLFCKLDGIQRYLIETLHTVSSLYTVVHYISAQNNKCRKTWKWILHTGNWQNSGFGGLEVACWPLVPKFTGSNPAEGVGFLRANKNPQHAFLWRGSKAVSPML